MGSDPVLALCQLRDLIALEISQAQYACTVPYKEGSLLRSTPVPMLIPQSGTEALEAGAALASFQKLWMPHGIQGSFPPYVGQSIISHVCAHYKTIYNKGSARVAVSFFSSLTIRSEHLRYRGRTGT